MAFSDTYPALHSHGLAPSMLLAIAEDSDNDFSEAVSAPVITNGTVMELYLFQKSNPSCTFYTLWKWLAYLSKEKWSKESFPTIKSLRQSVIRVVSKVNKLKKIPTSESKQAAIASFLDDVYSLPKVFSSERIYVMPQSSSSCSSCAEFETVKLVNRKLCHEISTLKEKNSSLEETDQVLSESRQKRYTIHRNMMKKVNRRDALIQQQQDEVKEGRKVINSLQARVVETDTVVSSLKTKLDRMRHRALYWKKKSDELKESCEEKILDTICTQDEVKAKLRDEIEELEYENNDLQDVVDDIMDEAKGIVCFQKGKFTDDVRVCCYELLSLNVGIRNVKTVINTVLSNIAHKEVDRLPGKTVLCDMMIESLTIAQAQISDELSKQDGDFYTLQTDGTTKHGQHFGTYDITTTDTTYNLGLRHVFSGTAQNTLETLKEILDDLDVVRKELGESAVSATIVQKMKNTMSDRHAAEKLFCDILSDYRADILPEAVSGWEQMCEAEQEQMTRMNNFFCGLHFLVGLADAAEATLKAWEATIEENVGDQKSSGVQRLIRTACKAFHHRGSEQAGCSTHFRAFLRRQGVSKVPLASFVGNRFNILFYDAAGVYFLKEHMIQYLSEFHGPQLNRLLQAVLHDLKTPHLIAGCHALGILDKVVTGPFWRYLQTSTVSVLDMSDVYTRMKDKFEGWGSDARDLIEHQDTLFEEHTHSDETSVHLFRPTSEYSTVLELLQLLCKAFSLTIQRLLLDHLPGGKFHNVSDPQIILETKSVPKTNVSPERDFAVLDRLISQKPNATHIALESILLFSKNKTTDWLQSKTPEEKEKLLAAARKLTSVQRSNYHKRRDEIVMERIKALESKERELVKKREKELRVKEELTLKIQHVGLWTCVEDVEMGLDKMSSKKAKVDSLKLQLNFRKKVLNQSHADKSIFQFSHNRKALSIQQLTLNLLTLLSDGPSDTNLSVIDQFLSSPEKLVYRRVEHLFECDGKEVWFRGTILAYNPNNHEFTIAYDNEEDVFKFPLVDDLKNGDLRIIS